MSVSVTITDREALYDGIRLAAVALQDAGIPYALCGGYAAWARGAPEPEHDADFCVREEDADIARTVLVKAGLEVVEPAENWLFKAYKDGQLIDVIFRMLGEQVPPEMFERSEVMEVVAVRMPVLEATDILSSQARVLSEHYCDLARLLPVARALREQVDWDRLRREIADNPYARAFVHLLDELKIATPPSR